AEAARKAEQQAAEEQARAAAAAKAEAARAQAETEARARLEAEALAKAARVKAEQDRVREEVERQRAAARAREEADHRQAEAARELASQEAVRIKAAAEQAERLSSELAEQEKAEQARVKAAEDARAAARPVDEAVPVAADMQPLVEAQTDAKILAAVVRLNAKHAAAEDSVFSAMEEKAADAAAVVTRDPSLWVTRSDSTSTPVVERRKSAAAVPGGGSRGGSTDVPVVERRTIIATVLFFDIIGYTKQPDKKQLALKHQFNKLVTDSLDSLDAGERIILDTGDGAAIGFLQHPTDALESAMHFRAALIVNKHCDYPELRVRIGIHLGPVSLVKDMNGQINMLGDGINSAQRVMSFAGQDQIYVSRAYFEFVSSLSDEYKDLFRYRGAQQDKHKREHQVYELLGAEADEPVQTQQPSSNLPSFNFEAFNTVLSRPDEQETLSPAEHQPVDDQMLMEVAGLMPAIDVNIEPVIQEEAVSQEASVIQEEAVHTEATPQFSEVEARQLVDVQAKKWEEAEQRAAEAARQKAESVPQKVFQRPVEAASAAKSAARPRRNPMPWGKLAAGLAALLIVALFAAPFVLPTQGYVASIEQALGAKLQQPVHIGHLSGRILPTPSLLLSDVYIGEAKQIQARQAQVNFSVAALFSSVKSIGSIELDGVQVNGAALRQVSGWLQQTAADPQYPIRRIALTKVQLDADGIQFSDVDGELTFDAAGRFTQARFNADGHKLALEISAASEQKLALSITLRDSALPLLPNWVFEDMKATGELSRDELRITELDSRIMGGVLTGDVRINWRAGWRVQGALVAKVIPLQNINKLLSGDLDGSARFQMQAANLAKLADAAVLNGAFSVKKGLINGVDIVETTRLRSRESLPGGRTHFDELSGELSYANGSYQFRQLKMKDNMVKAFGSLTVRRQKLTGNISADLTMRPGAVALQVGGTTESPSLHAAY
ncbi:MAG: AsmA-like C-terminal region-containing protein, partial [Gallionella sp.]|nr:AsmA-like C-terminal region-containing protein [Gallionella sp.]